MITDRPTRWTPEIPFPSYAYIPGRRPHPNRDPRGHSDGRTPEPATPFEPSRWREHRRYLYGVDLFNYGYYWEAHEAWEELWKEATNASSLRAFLQALIKLAAAEVKRLEGNGEGVKRHRARAAQLFCLAWEKTGEPNERFAGASWRELTALAERSIDDSAGPLIRLE